MTGRITAATLALLLLLTTTAHAAAGRIGNDPLEGVGAQLSVGKAPAETALFLDRRSPATGHGVINEFTYYQVADGVQDYYPLAPFRIVVVDADRIVTWVSAVITPTGDGEIRTHQPDEPVAVTAGSQIGLYQDQPGVHPVGNPNQQGGGTPTEVVLGLTAPPEPGDPIQGADVELSGLLSLGADIVPAGPTSKDDCKKGGWRTYSDPSFRNQGQCIAYVNHGS